MAAVQNRILIDLSDILRIRVRCTDEACRHEMLHPLDISLPLPTRCTRCQREFWNGQPLSSPEGDIVDRIQKLATLNENRRLELVLEIDADTLTPS
ncbi:MAG: hypothetical protein OXI70_12185 [Chloroflexota bacterium]|nr:hypothetical protein [Chloroflexota bacterium]